MRPPATTGDANVMASGRSTAQRSVSAPAASSSAEPAAARGVALILVPAGLDRAGKRLEHEVGGLVAVHRQRARRPLVARGGCRDGVRARGDLERVLAVCVRVRRRPRGVPSTWTRAAATGSPPAVTVPESMCTATSSSVKSRTSSAPATDRDLHRSADEAVRGELDRPRAFLQRQLVEAGDGIARRPRGRAPAPTRARRSGRRGRGRHRSACSRSARP